MTPHVAVRPDGWPLCPRCEADEVYSLLGWQGQPPPLVAFIAAGLKCYACGWTSEPWPVYRMDPA